MIYQKIINVMEDINPLGKIKREDIVPKLLPILTKYKIAIRPAEVTDYKYMNQEASFIMKYELIDTEDKELKSIIIQIPGGGFDQDGKGRATYMASTGAYRQALQQIFSIPIEEESQQNNVDYNDQNGFSPFDEFQDSKSKENINEEKSIEELTDEDIEAEFAKF